MTADEGKGNASRERKDSGYAAVVLLMDVKELCPRRKELKSGKIARIKV